jgi:hypothetical protein
MDLSMDNVLLDKPFLTEVRLAGWKCKHVNIELYACRLRLSLLLMRARHCVWLCGARAAAM